MSSQQEFLEAVSRSQAIRTTVRAIIVHNDQVLVQQPSDEPESCYAFINGRIEVGELAEERLRAELLEELGATVASSRYLFFVENRFAHGGELVHLHEHFFLVELARYELESREPELVQTWLPRQRLIDFDVRPHVVRDAICRNAHLDARHMVVQP